MEGVNVAIFILKYEIILLTFNDLTMTQLLRMRWYYWYCDVCD